MLVMQFLQTTKELQSLCASKLISEQDKAILGRFIGQEVNDANFFCRNQALEKLNSQLAKKVVDAPMMEKICANDLGLTRIPQNLLEVLLRNQVVIKTINLSNNSLRFLPIEILTLPSLESIDLRLNYFTPKECEKLQKVKTVQFLLDPQQMQYETFEEIALQDDEPAPVLLSGGPAVKASVPVVRSVPPASSQKDKRSGECFLM